MRKVVIVSYARTPIGSFLGALSSVPATQLGSIAIKGAMDKIQLDPKHVQEVFMGHVVQANTGQSPAKQASLGAGISNNVPATAVNKVCASGMKSIILAAQSIALGDQDVVIAGGMENMSQIPHYLHLRNPQKFGPATMVDGMQRDGLVDAYDQQAMGVCADLCATENGFTREDQDQFAIQSYERSAAAWKAGKFKDEVVPVAVKQRRGDDIVVDTDEEFTNVKMDKIPSLRAAFTKDGTVTAANASTINDGAAAIILMSEEKAKELNIQPLASIVSYADASVEPERFTTAPSKALPKALKKAQLELKDMDYIELNEAFAVVGLANMKLLGIKDTNVNVYGGAVSLGHPLGCSGTRIVTTLLSTLKNEGGKLGAAAICNGGGGASAIVIESYN
ncbi:acetyl-CoA acetyltransferase [Nonlabens sp. YIK11]|uniref:acetyl-CoA C-acyltransferase n=1 Tax=Nonlabens sp. YIK11 TaxID=1453349 RepID=UPI0006DC9932|nr:acetyl-CoA C-acyltransferase [Nonlabens sp. YIK11]KQC34010.1 acetyl-CoA acetyltransferase [Nonlabens sp. YIK11]